MSKEVPTPYIWSFQPQSGRAAGAAQDYSTRLHWFGAGPHMINQVYNIRDTQNRILMSQASLLETPRQILNPTSWPSVLLPQNKTPPVTIELPRNVAMETAMTNAGAQLAGGKHINVGTLEGHGLTLSEHFPSVGALRADGTFQLAGGSRSSFNPSQAFLTLQQSSSKPRSGGLGTWQFVKEFVPTVYLNPFSGSPDTFPDQFMPNYNITTDSVQGYN